VLLNSINLFNMGPEKTLVQKTISWHCIPRYTGICLGQQIALLSLYAVIITT